MSFAAQGGNTEADDKATSAIGELVASEQPGSMVTKFIVVLTTIDKDGDESISTFTSLGLKRWESLGLLHFAVQMEDGRTDLEEDE